MEVSDTPASPSGKLRLRHSAEQIRKGRKGERRKREREIDGEGEGGVLIMIKLLLREMIISMLAPGSNHISSPPERSSRILMWAEFPMLLAVMVIMSPRQIILHRHHHKALIMIFCQNIFFT